MSAVAPDGRKMLRLEVRNSQTPIERKPEWIKTRAKMGPEYKQLQQLVKGEGLHTVCQEAGCPNIFECWEDREATFLIGGDQCTRRCDFCQIDTGKPQALDRDEPRRVGESVVKMDLNYATITGVARDDLEDGGSWLYAETVRQIHTLTAEREAGATKVELLIPDFNAEPEQLAEVFSSRPEVLAHNVETVPRIFKRIRPGFRYERSLEVITRAREAGLVTKSNLILGMGETREEVSEALQDLYDAGCELITITQYLRPSLRHHPVERWVKPMEFVELKDEADAIGYSGVMSGPRAPRTAGPPQGMRCRAAERCADRGGVHVRDADGGPGPRNGPGPPRSPGLAAHLRLRGYISGGSVATSQALWLHPDLYGTAEAVVEAAPVAVPDEGGDDEQEQDGPYEDAPEAEAAAVLGDHTEPQETLAGGAADGADGEGTHQEEDAERPVPRRLLVTASEQPVCDHHADRPVDEDGPETTAERGDRPRPLLGQPEPLAAVAEVGAHLFGGRAGPREPRSDCLPVVHPSTVLRPGLGPAGRGTETAAEMPPTPAPVNLGETNGSCLRNPVCLWSGPACATALAAPRATTPSLPGRE
ncbi:Lipoyl synthase, organellar chromatophore [Streptomyces microflavus]